MKKTSIKKDPAEKTTSRKPITQKTYRANTTIPQIYLKLYHWISIRSFDVTHNDLPNKYVESFSGREMSSNTILVMMLSEIRLRNAQLRGLREPEGTLVEFISELDLKMRLRRYQDYFGAKTPGLPLFQMLGQEFLIAHFRKLKNSAMS